MAVMKRLFEEIDGEIIFLDELCVICADFLTDFELESEVKVCLMCEAELEQGDTL